MDSASPGPAKRGVERSARESRVLDGDPHRSRSLNLEPSIEIRTELRPGDLGAITQLHGTLYARERGWDPTFEAYVAAGLAEFVLRYDPRRDRLWVAELEGRIVGSIAIQGRDEGTAQLRWFLVVPDYRGSGMGGRLLEDALAFCRSRGFRLVFLWTVAELTEAARLYLAAGFRCVEEQRHQRWGTQVVEQRYEWTPGSGTAGPPHPETEPGSP